MHPGTGLDPYLRRRLGAGLALLQPSIDPVFLVLLSAHSGLAPANHGLVVGASQAGMAVGALLAAFMPRAALRLAAIAGVAAALLTVLVDGLIALLVLRAVCGLAAGLLYAAMLRAAVEDAGTGPRNSAHAMGTILLFQLVFATLLALLLPIIAHVAGPAVALLGLAAVPFASLMLLPPVTAEPALTRHPPPPAAAPQRLDPAMLAVFMFVAASAMIWSYVGAAAEAAGLSDQTIGIAVALGSLAAGGVALALAQATPRLPVVVTGLIAALAMAMPLVMPFDTLSFIIGMVAFNIGATYAFVRFSALAIDRPGSAGNLVPTLQAMAMVFGPLAGAAAVSQGGFLALGTLSALTLLVAVTAIVIDGQRRSTGADEIWPSENFVTAGKQALTET